MAGPRVQLEAFPLYPNEFPPLAIGTVATGAPGTSVSAEIAIRNGEQFLDLSIPQGAPGDVSASNASAAAAASSASAAANSANSTALAIQNFFLSNPVNVKTFGAIGDGVADDTAAAQRAITQANAAGKAVYWPAGRYRLKARLLSSNAPFVHKGDGIDVTVLVWDANSTDGGGFSASFNSDLQFTHVSDMSINTLGKGGTALYLDYTAQIVPNNGNPVAVGRDAPRFAIERVKMYGADTVFNTWWDRGVDVVSGQIGFFDKFFFDGGIGTKPSDLKSSQAIIFRGAGHPVGLWVLNSSINHVNYAINAIGMEGLHVIGCDLVGVNVGVCFDDSVGDAIYGRPHCLVLGGHINANTVGVQILNGTEFLIQGNDIYLCSDTDHDGYGIYVTGSAARSGTIIGNNFTNTTSSATVAGSKTMTAVNLNLADGVYVGGNRFRKATEAPMRGIAIEAGCTRIKVDDNNTFYVDPYIQTSTGKAFMDVEVLDQAANTVMPGLHSLVYKQGADQVIPAGAATAVGFDTVYSARGNNGMFNPASNTALTVASYGRYRVIANVTWDQTPGGVRSASIYKNGNLIPGMSADQKPAATGCAVQHALTCSINECAQGDYFQVKVYTNTGASVVKGPSTWFSLERVSG